MLQACYGTSEVLLGLYAICDTKTGSKLFLSQKYTLVRIKTFEIAVCQMEEFHSLVIFALNTGCSKIEPCPKHPIFTPYDLKFRPSRLF